MHCHSAFSLLDGASSPEELVDRANNIGLSALAITDHDDMGGAVRFAAAARESSLDAIIGAELSLAGDYHIILLARNLEGYKNICHLITKARMTAENRGLPRSNMELLAEHANGVVALSGCPHGEIPYLLARGEFDRARQAACLLKDIYGEHFFLELWDHDLRQEAVICRGLLRIAGAEAIPWVVTNNAHYAAPEKRIIHDVLTCLKHDVTLSTAGRRLRPNGNWCLKSPREMVWRWRSYPEGVSNTLLVAERCAFRLGMLKPDLPEIDPARLRPSAELMQRVRESLGAAVLDWRPDITAPQIVDAQARRHALLRNEILYDLVWSGARERYNGRLTEQHIRQLQHELRLITQLDLAPYFLIMRDIICFAEERDIMVQGRGSAANSAVCYCLKITAVDPIGMDLLFERFISEERNEPPDIDLDIAHQEREHVLQYVYEKYGREHAAMVCEHISYRGRSAVRDAARIFDFSPEQADKLAAEVHYREAGDAAAALLDGGAERAGLDPRDRRVQLLIKVVAGLHQLPRHRSIHVGGFVLSGEPIGRIVPVEPASMPGRTVIQWDKDDIDLVGLIKIDLLGLGILTMIQQGVKLIKQHRQIDLDLSQLDMSDPAIYEMLQKADTVGVFQVESRAQMNILPKIRPKCFYDIVISIAIVRPGPIQGNIVHPYLRRRRGTEDVTYLHPSIEPILKRTLGVPLFQEQGMKLAVVAAGFTASQADQLRRVMSHKRSLEKMAYVCDQLAAGMRKNGLSEEAIETITFQLKAFANYGFPESHAASFSLLVFASAYIKRYFAPEFFCAILNAQPMGFYSPATLIRDAMRHGVEVRPVDLSKSDWDCTLEDPAETIVLSNRDLSDAGLPTVVPRSEAPEARGTRPLQSAINPIANGGTNQPALRIGLRYVGGLGPAAKMALLHAKATGGPFTSLEDVCRRSGLGAKDLEKLAAAGAFESFCPGRRKAMWAVLRGIRYRQERPLLALLEALTPESNQIPAMTDLEITMADYNLTGLSTGNHPMVYYRAWAQNEGLVSSLDLPSCHANQSIRIGAGVICRQQPSTAKGFVFLTVEDEFGTANVIIKPNIFQKFRDTILGHNFLLIAGKLQKEEGVLNIIADSFKSMPRISSGQAEIPVASRDFH
ncbi:MAG: error-prone DNA polymerase [Candidatus Obscuribacterales bacterium]|nr:error-prone DNA polymerase [Candidatus Obscuribacterales bacterium]